MCPEDSLNPISRPVQSHGEDSATQRMNVTQNLAASDVAENAIPLIGKWAEIAKEIKSSHSSHTFQSNVKGRPFSNSANAASKIGSSIFRRSAEMLGVNSKIASSKKQTESKKKKP